MRIRYRKAKKKDLQQICDLVEDNINKNSSEGYLERPFDEYDLKNAHVGIYDKKVICVCCLSDVNPLLKKLYKEYISDGKFIYCVCVKKDMRKGGIMRDLYTSLDLKGHVYVEILEGNNNSVIAHERCGFVKMHECVWNARIYQLYLKVF